MHLPSDIVCLLQDAFGVSLHLDDFLQVNERSAVCRAHAVDLGPRLAPARRLYAVSRRRVSPPSILLKFGEPRRLQREAKALERMEQSKVPRVPRKVLAGTVCVGDATLHVLGVTFFEGTSLVSDDAALTAEGSRLLRETLRAIHDCGLVHRDVKPDNIVITKEGPPILVDFDCAGDIGEKGFMGTSMWASPKALLGLGADPGDDFYSLERIPVLSGGVAHTTFTHSPPTPPKV